jgi:ABC-type sugar transport system ATPase subunit
MVFQSYALYPHTTVYDNMLDEDRQGKQGRSTAGAPAWKSCS